MEQKELKRLLAPLTQDKMSWDAFIILLDNERSKIIKQLETNHPTDTLIRLNAQLCLLRSLKQTRENINANS
jgi:hypothetical protein